jgi:phosphate-selective porin OprO and OprP
VNGHFGRISAGFVLLVVSLTGGATDLMAQDRLSQLEDRIRQLEAELMSLKSEVQSLRNQKSPGQNREKSDHSSTRVALSDRGLEVESPERKLALRFKGYYQVEARGFFSGNNAPGVDTIEPRRIRPIVEMKAGDFSFRIAPELSGDSQDLRDAYATWKFADEFELLFGKMKPPIGLERLQSAPALPLAERGLTTELTPIRDIGLMLRGETLEGNLEYAIGLFNGAPDGENERTELDNGKEVDFRFFFHPWRPQGSHSQGLGIGLGGNAGNRIGLPRPYYTSVRTPFFSYLPGAVSDGDTWRLAPQADFYWGPLGLMTEYIVSSRRIRYAADARDLTNSAWQVRGSYVLTGEHASYSGVRPRGEFRPSEGEWGALELAGRISQFKIDRQTFPLFANPTVSARKATGLGMALNWYPARLIRVTIDYETTSFDLLAGKKPREHAFTSRLQFAY